MYFRLAESSLLDALSDTPVVLIVGARQAGKSTLAKQARRDTDAYITLDDAILRNAAIRDPDGFVANLPPQVIIDEIQLAPEIFRSIKALVDRNRAPGHFLLTGSANILLLPKLSESLAGRMEIITLWPLSQTEIELGMNHANISQAPQRLSLIDLLFGSDLPTQRYAAVMRDDLAGRIVAGGYPEPVSRSSEARRRAWFDSYLATVLQRDIREISNIAGISDLPTLLSLIASRSASLANYSEVSRTLGIPLTTLLRYLTLLRTIYLVWEIPAWSANLGKRLIRSPKIHLCDTGLASQLLKVDKSRLLANGTLFGQLLETFAVMEFQKMLGWSSFQPRLFHFRTAAGAEVDILLELQTGEIVGIEVKSARSVSPADFRGLEVLRETTGDKFVRGVVLYSGEHTVSFGDRLVALPLSALWT